MAAHAAMRAVIDPRQPVLVGVGTCQQLENDFQLAQEPMDLMLQAVRRAGVDAGAAEALSGVQSIAVPKGRWRYQNPAGEIARAIGADSAATVLASVGVLQQTLIGNACLRIANGEIHSALIAGADAGHRILNARRAGVRATERQQDDTPDVVMEAADALLHPAELAAGIRMPVALYAVLASAWRARHGLSVEAHRSQMGALYASFSAIAAANPEAWLRQPLDALDISKASERNPMQAFPYTRRHCTSWNVDQSAALLLCSAGRAQALGIPSVRWVYPLASTESNHMTAVSARASLSSCAGARLAGAAALNASGLLPTQLDLIELYSCFPVAVEMVAEALGIETTRDVTITGGMPFAGGPFNNYVLQATCRMAQLIREGRGRAGLVSSVSGIMTKQGFGIWASQPSANGFAFKDVSAETAACEGVKEVDSHFAGAAVVAGYTVLHDKDQLPRALVLANTAAGTRTLAWSKDPAVAQRLQSSEFCGAAITVQDGVFAPA